MSRSRGLRVAAWLLLAVALCVAAAIAALLVFVLPEAAGSITINGEVLDLHGVEAGHWLVVTGGVLVAMMVALVLVPAALLLGLGLPALIAGLVLLLGLVVAGFAVAVALSPLLLVLALVWWLWKRSGRRARMPG